MTDLRPDELRRRYGVPMGDPRRGAWGAFDLGVGWLLGLATLVAIGIVHAAVTWVTAPDESAAAALLAYPLYGVIPLTAYGLPSAALAAHALRRVRSPWIHALAFAALGGTAPAVIAVLLSALSREPNDALPLAAEWVMAAGIPSAVVAVTARIGAMWLALRRWRRHDSPAAARPVAAG